MTLRVAPPALAAHAESVNPGAAAILQAGRAGHASVTRLDTERRGGLAPAVISDVTGDACVIDTLAEAQFTAAGVVDTGHTRVAVVPGHADGSGSSAAPVRAHFAGLAGALHAIWRVGIATIAIAQTRHAGDAAGTERGLAPTAGVVGHITERAVAAHALAGLRVSAIAIGHTGRAGCAVVDAERLVRPTARVIGRVAELARVGDTLATVAIAIGSAPETRAAIGGTEGGLATAAAIISRVAGQTGVVDALAGPRLATIEVFATADTIEFTIDVDTNRGIARAALV